jgi:hypothetical protein
MSLREVIFAATDLPSERVEVPEWGVTLNVRTMSGTERDAFEQSIVVGEKISLENIRAKLCVRCIVDDAGQPVFEAGDADELGRKSSRALDRLFSVAQKLNGMGKKDLEELQKNSGTGLSAGSGAN